MLAKTCNSFTHVDMAIGQIYPYDGSFLKLFP
jgi:hypothetical protein